MKRFLAVICGCLLLHAGIGQSSQTGSPLIDVVGEAEVKLRPDFISMWIMVEEEKEDPEKAQQAVMEEATEVLRFLREQGSIEKTRTQNIQLQPRVRDYQKGTRTYNAQQIISFEISSIGDYDAVVLGLLKRGIDGIHNVEFKSSEEEKHREELLKKALANARQKAKMMAAELDQSIGTAVFISDRISRGPQPMDEQMYKSGVRVSSSVEPGEISLSASVNVRFQLK